VIGQMIGLDYTEIIKLFENLLNNFL